MSEELDNINPSGSVPESRITDPVKALDLAKDIIKQNQSRDQRNARVKGLVDGNAPYSQNALNKAGQKYRSNFNSGQALAFLQSSFTAYYDLFAEVSTYATVTCRSGNPKDDEWSKVLTDEFHQLQKKDPAMDYGIQLAQHEMVLYGAGPTIWERDDDWVSYPKRNNKVLVANNEPSDITRWTKCVVEERLTPAELYAYISNPKAASNRGWNVEAVRKSLLLADTPYARYPQDWDKLQQEIRNNDLYYTRPDKAIQIARIFYKEFPTKGDKEGKISEVWVDLQHDHGFLYRKVRKYNSWKEILCPFMLDRGDGTYHSIKGIGVRMYSFLLSKERLNNSVVDNAFVMASLHIKNQQSGAMTPDSMVHMGPFTVWKNNFEPMAFNQVGGAIDGALAVSKAMDQELQSNLAQFRPQVAQPQGNPRTAFEVASNVSQQSVLTKTGIQRYFEQLDDWYTERFRRALTIPLNSFTSTAKAAKEFRRKVKERGVPDGIYKSCEITATRTIGQGSHFLRTQTLQNLLGSVAGSLPEGGRVNLLDDYIAATAGFSMVDRYNPKNRMATTEQDHEWDAMQENATFRIGGEVTLTDTQNDVVHALTHMSSVAEGLASLEQGGNPEEILVYSISVMRHTAEHLARLEGDPLREGILAELTPRFEGLQKQVEELSNMVEEAGEQQAEAQQSQQQAQAVEQGTDPDVQIKQARAQMDMQIQQAKAQQDMELQKKQAEQQMQIASATAANSIQNSKKV
jgi:hypothetical protein